ncbi:hypothetical protein QAD02_007434 [Eretmocerus hayati]|uniref:Uncharacterized protein n=1 Tax=Eretmocerus hayati TaxID=131215 RepID=A0ACC2N643_9HYME|nr:hypothetical protein QAD02_007434 [Eretmocerus hayati]
MLHFVQLQYSVLAGQKEAFSRRQKNNISLFNDGLLQEYWQKLNKTMSPIHFVTVCANEIKRFLPRWKECDEMGDNEDEGEESSATDVNIDLDGNASVTGDAEDVIETEDAASSEQTEQNGESGKPNVADTGY